MAPSRHMLLSDKRARALIIKAEPLLPVPGENSNKEDTTVEVDGWNVIFRAEFGIWMPQTIYRKAEVASEGV